MLQSNDLVLILTNMSAQGVEGADRQIRNCIGKPISQCLDTLAFINEHRQLDVTRFYERVRENHNEKRSSLYKNIVRDDLDSDGIITTLHAFALQVALFARHVSDSDRNLFYKHARAEEVARVLEGYYRDFDLTSALKLLRLIKADLLVFEYISGRRDAQGRVVQHA